MNKAEIEAMAASIDMDVEQFSRKFVRLVGIRCSLTELPNGDCVFYDTASRGCRVYRVRPRQCRTWPFWPSNLKSREEWDAMAEECPGANRGRLYTLGEIEQRAGVLRV